jgi:outer membrane lipopolysaccharide assembly protein LptE/RlpB
MFRRPAVEREGSGSPAAGGGRGLLVAALVCAGCGYQLARTGTLPRAARAVRVSAVDNRTAQAEAGGLFAAALRSELSARGELAGDGTEAPLLEIELAALRNAPSAFGAATAPAFRVEADLRFRLREQTGTIAYEDATTGAEDYLVGVDVLGTEANRRAALRRLATTLAREAVERMEIAARLQ